MKVQSTPEGNAKQDRHDREHWQSDGRSVHLALV